MPVENCTGRVLAEFSADASGLKALLGMVVAFKRLNVASDASSPHTTLSIGMNYFSNDTEISAGLLSLMVSVILKRLALLPDEGSASHTAPSQALLPRLIVTLLK
jgi:hypothetical protein